MDAVKIQMESNKRSCRLRWRGSQAVRVFIERLGSWPEGPGGSRPGSPSACRSERASWPSFCPRSLNIWTVARHCSWKRKLLLHQHLRPHPRWLAVLCGRLRCRLLRGDCAVCCAATAPHRRPQLRLMLRGNCAARWAAGGIGLLGRCEVFVPCLGNPLPPTATRGVWPAAARPTTLSASVARCSVVQRRTKREPERRDRASQQTDKHSRGR